MSGASVGTWPDVQSGAVQWAVVASGSVRNTPLVSHLLTPSSPPTQVCCLPRSPWSTSSRGLPPRASAAAPAAAAALTAHPALPHPGARPVLSPPPAGLSEGQAPAPAPHSRVKSEGSCCTKFTSLHGSRVTSHLARCQSSGVPACPGSVQVLLYSGGRERPEGRAGQRCPIRDCPGELGGVRGQPASQGCPGHPLLGTVC